MKRKLNSLEIFYQIGLEYIKLYKENILLKNNLTLKWQIEQKSAKEVLNDLITRLKKRNIKISLKGQTLASNYFYKTTPNICHGDLHINNIIYDEKNRNVYFIDPFNELLFEKLNYPSFIPNFGGLEYDLSIYLISASTILCQLGEFSSFFNEFMKKIIIKENLNNLKFINCTLIALMRFLFVLKYNLMPRELVEYLKEKILNFLMDFIENFDL